MALEAELARSRAAAIRDGIAASEAGTSEVTDQIISVIRRTERGADIVYGVDIDADIKIPFANGNLMGVLGAPIENATRLARRQVLNRGHATSMSAKLAVEDDGPGLSISTGDALTRGGRLDEAGSGNHDRALPIVRNIIKASNRQLALGKSGLGGRG